MGPGASPGPVLVSASRIQPGCSIVDHVRTQVREVERADIEAVNAATSVGEMTLDLARELGPVHRVPRHRVDVRDINDATPEAHHRSSRGSTDGSFYAGWPVACRCS